MNHTPAPWIDNGEGHVVCRAGDIARMLSDNPADARLIASAPALLDALEELLSEVTANTYPKALAELGAIGRASAAIAAARGDA